MNILQIKKKNFLVSVIQVKVKELNKEQCSAKFLSHNLPDETLVYIKCFPDGTFDLRGKKREYRIVNPD
jgi:hypothetical protein